MFEALKDINRFAYNLIASFNAHRYKNRRN